jgi:hypothetical protein
VVEDVVQAALQISERFRAPGHIRGTHGAHAARPTAATGLRSSGPRHALPQGLAGGSGAVPVPGTSAA